MIVPTHLRRVLGVLTLTLVALGSLAGSSLANHEGAQFECGSEPGPDDHYFCDQWALYNDGSFSLYFPLERIWIAEEGFDLGALEAWRLLEERAPGRTVRIAIISAGVDAGHEDLGTANFVVCAEALSGDGSLDEGPCEDGFADDETGDGTAMAGLIAAERDNDIGLAGLASDVELVMGKVAGADHLVDEDDYLAMLRWAIDKNADVIAIHFATPECKSWDAERKLLLEAHRNGALIVATGGVVGDAACADPYHSPRYPGSYDTLDDGTRFVVSVGSSNAKGEVWTDDVIPAQATVCNDHVDIMAPGEYIWAPSIPAPDAPDRKYNQWSGSTPSVAYVAGVAAILMSQEGLSNAEVYERLLATAIDVEPHPYRPGDCHGVGQVNLAQALAAGPLLVDIDIKPGSDENPITTNSAGLVPVAVLTTDRFDAPSIDTTSVRFGPSSAQATGSGVEDVDGDGDLDLILHFDQQQTGLRAGDTEACLEGRTHDGRNVRGCDRVTVR